MNIWVIALIVGMIVIAGGAITLVKANQATPEGTTKITSCSGCGNQCTAGNNCGSSTCGAKTGGTCTCGLAK